ncbi:hypothetical protein H8356DRAFT_1730471 [Neocallimastix lanati (nom. inval.)]|jgi:hypothetical protein|nr:hypothetical protein H8356DRAFT_1730471 [Neocallimastix sp. JGI-2020a]
MNGFRFDDKAIKSFINTTNIYLHVPNTMFSNNFKYQYLNKLKNNHIMFKNNYNKGLKDNKDSKGINKNNKKKYKKKSLLYKNIVLRIVYKPEEVQHGSITFNCSLESLFNIYKIFRILPAQVYLIRTKILSINDRNLSRMIKKLKSSEIDNKSFEVERLGDLDKTHFRYNISLRVNNAQQTNGFNICFIVVVSSNGIKCISQPISLISINRFCQKEASLLERLIAKEDYETYRYYDNILFAEDDSHLFKSSFNYGIKLRKFNNEYFDINNLSMEMMLNCFKELTNNDNDDDEKIVNQTIRNYSRSIVSIKNLIS